LIIPYNRDRANKFWSLAPPIWGAATSGIDRNLRNLCAFTEKCAKNGIIVRTSAQIDRSPIWGAATSGIDRNLRNLCAFTEKCAKNGIIVRTSAQIDRSPIWGAATSGIDRNLRNPVRFYGKMCEKWDN